MRLTKFVAIAGLSGLGLLLSCESVKVEGPTGPSGGDNVTVSSVTVSPNSFTINAGSTQQLSATVRGSNGSTITNKTVNWTSSSTSVATVSSSGLVTGVAMGTVTITGSVDGVTGTSAGNIGNPTPAITSLSPNVGNVGQNDVTLSVVGSGFVTSSVVRVDNVDRSTQYVSATQLQTTIRAEELESPGPLQITVHNPSPGGGTSSAVVFEVGMCTKGVLTPDEPESNNLAAGDCRLDDGEYFHTWTFEATQGQVYQAALTSDFVDPYVIVYDDTRSKIGEDDDSDYEVDSRFSFRAPSTGTYMVLVTSYEPGETGSYSVRLSNLVELTLDTPGVGQIPVAGQGSGVGAATEGPSRVEGVPVDRFGVLVNPDLVLLAEARPAGTSASLDPAMELFEAVEQISPAGGNNDTDPILASGGEVILSLPDDDRYASIDLYGANGSTGNYEIAVQSCRLFVVTLGGSTNGTTSLANDCALAGAGSAEGWPSAVIGFVGDAGQSIILSASSSWDNFLLLLAEDGSFVGFDDDSGTGLNGQIAVTLPQDGIYLAILAPYLSGITGDFSISLTSGVGAPSQPTSSREKNPQGKAGVPIFQYLSRNLEDRPPDNPPSTQGPEDRGKTSTTKTLRRLERAPSGSGGF